MIKIFEKIRYALLGERTVTEKGNLIIKDKKLSDNQKMLDIFTLYSKYLNSPQFDNDVVMETYEMYYEEFMIDDVKHPLRYERIKNEVAINQRYLICTQIVRQIAQLKKIDKNLCNNEQLKLLENLKFFADRIYTPQFDYASFYMDKNYREHLDPLNVKLIENIKQICPQIVENRDDSQDIFTL